MLSIFSNMGLKAVLLPVAVTFLLTGALFFTAGKFFFTRDTLVFISLSRGTAIKLKYINSKLIAL